MIVTATSNSMSVNARFVFISVSLFQRRPASKAAPHPASSALPGSGVGLSTATASRSKPPVGNGVGQGLVDETRRHLVVERAVERIEPEPTTSTTRTAVMCRRSSCGRPTSKLRSNGVPKPARHFPARPSRSVGSMALNWLLSWAICCVVCVSEMAGYRSKCEPSELSSTNACSRKESLNECSKTVKSGPVASLSGPGEGEGDRAAVAEAHHSAG